MERQLETTQTWRCHRSIIMNTILSPPKAANATVLNVDEKSSEEMQFNMLGKICCWLYTNRSWFYRWGLAGHGCIRGLKISQRISSELHPCSTPASCLSSLMQRQSVATWEASCYIQHKCDNSLTASCEANWEEHFAFFQFIQILGCHAPLREITKMLENISRSISFFFHHLFHLSAGHRGVSCQSNSVISAMTSFFLLLFEFLWVDGLCSACSVMVNAAHGINAGFKTAV